MAINLKRQRAQLVSEIAADLEHVVIYSGVLPMFWQMRAVRNLHSAFGNSDQGKLVREILGEHAFEIFITHELERAFKGEEWIEGTSPLSAHQGFEDLSLVAERLVDRFSTLPWKYNLTVRLPDPVSKAFPESFDELAIAPGVRLVSGKGLREHLPLMEAKSLLMNLALNVNGGYRWHDSRVYLTFDVSGYLSSCKAESYFASRDKAYSFYGLSIALGLMSSFAERYGQDRDLDQWAFHVHLNDGTEFLLENSSPLDQHHADWLACVGTQEVDASRHLAVLDDIGLVFRSPHGGRLLLAARWLFESYCSRDNLQQYIQAAVAMEILLGDQKPPEDIGLTSLMATRCAYLIGHTPEARQDLEKNFREIYRLRSKIVHTGQSRLSPSEQDLLVHLRILCAAVIRAELRLLRRAEQDSAKGA